MAINEILVLLTVLLSSLFLTRYMVKSWERKRPSWLRQKYGVYKKLKEEYLADSVNQKIKSSYEKVTGQIKRMLPGEYKTTSELEIAIEKELNKE